jgi:hypothetical protein
MEMDKSDFGAYIIIMIFFVLMGSCSAINSNLAGPEASPKVEPAGLEEQWGVKVVAIRSTARGLYLDFRYRVVDSEKASLLFDRDTKPYLVDEATGASSSLASAPKLGTLRTKGIPKADREYFMIFGSLNGLIKKGSKVTVVVGDFKARNLIVE